MGILYLEGKRQVKSPIAHDPEEKTYYSFVYRPKTWVGEVEYLLDDVVIPSTPNGFYYICVNPGISGATEPSFGTSINSTTLEASSSVLWQAKPYNAMLNTGDTIAGHPTTPNLSSSWGATSGVTIDNANFLDGVTWCRVTAVPENVTEIILTNTIYITRASGFVEKKERSLVIPVKQL